jgi:thymidine kinase
MIEIILGPMYSGKTTRLMDMVEASPGLVVDFSLGLLEKGFVKNHDGRSVPCVTCHHLKHLEDMDLPLKIYINEAQFFPDLIDFIRAYESSRDIYLFGLDGDYLREPFGQIHLAISYCDTLTKLRGTCVRCKRPSCFSKRITPDTEQMLMDETAYIPVCRKCYLLAE